MIVQVKRIFWWPTIRVIISKSGPRSFETQYARNAIIYKNTSETESRTLAEYQTVGVALCIKQNVTPEKNLNIIFSKASIM